MTILTINDELQRQIVGPYERGYEKGYSDGYLRGELVGALVSASVFLLAALTFFATI